MTAAATLWRFTPLIILAFVWEGVTQLGIVSELSLPPVSKVAASFVQMFAEDLWYHTGRSILRGGSGFLAAVVIGVLAGVLMAWYRPVRILVNPIMRCFYPMPKSALIPLTIMWIGLGDASKVTLIFIGCLLPIVMSAYNAARGVDEVLIWSARGMGATNREVLWEVVVPASLPDILSGIRISLALSFILMVAGELIIANDGIGYLIDILGEGCDLAGIFAGVVTISAVGFFADRGYVALMRRSLIWRE
jgi:NitT/TauT family transport system permease protein